MDRDWLDRLAHDLAATRAELLGLLVLLVGGVVLTVVVVGRTAGTPVAASQPPGPTPSASSAGLATGSGSSPSRAPGGSVDSPAGAATDPVVVVVYVTGAVRSPGVVELPAGTRLVDAIEAAGGATGDAAAEVLNLAAVLVDGQRLHVPTGAEVEAAASPAPGTGTPGPVGLDPTTGLPPTAVGAGGASTAAPAITSDGLLDLNLATPDELEELPGVGPVLAGRIADWRDRAGGFTSVGQLREVSGIGEKTFQSLAPLVAVR